MAKDGYVFKIPVELEDKMNELMERTGLRTKREIVAHALATFDWVLSEKVRGKSVYAAKEDSKGNVTLSELIWPFFVKVDKK